MSEIHIDGVDINIKIENHKAQDLEKHIRRIMRPLERIRALVDLYHHLPLHDVIVEWELYKNTNTPYDNPKLKFLNRLLNHILLEYALEFVNPNDGPDSGNDYDEFMDIAKNYLSGVITEDELQEYFLTGLYTPHYRSKEELEEMEKWEKEEIQKREEHECNCEYCEEGY